MNRNCKELINTGKGIQIQNLRTPNNLYSVSGSRLNSSSMIFIYLLDLDNHDNGTIKGPYKVSSGANIFFLFYFILFRKRITD